MYGPANVKFTVRVANPFLDLQLAWSSFTTDHWMCLSQFPPSHPFSTINPLKAELNPICHLLALLGAHHFLHVSRIRVNKISSLDRIRLPACLHVWNQNSKFIGSMVQSNVYSVQAGNRDLAQRRRSILQLWPSDIVLSETSKQQESMTTSAQFFFIALCTFVPNLSNRTRISARTVPQERYFSSMEWI